MPTAPRILQRPDQIVDLNGWELDQDNPYGLPGRRAKQIFVCPNPPPFGFLIGGHRYLFKEPSEWRSPQIWSEVIAYEISRDLGIAVPPAFLATSPGNRRPGVLIEFFFGYPAEEKFRYVDAINLLQGQGFEVNFRHGSLRDNISLCRRFKIPGWKEWWSRVIALDAIVGNVDRHSQNWGMLIRTGSSDGALGYYLAPAFDNGSSLGYNFPDENLPMQLADVRQLVKRGRHHLGWVGGQEGEGHASLCQRLDTLLPGGLGQSMDDAMQLGDVRIDEVARWCTEFDFPLRFSHNRAQFVALQLRLRRDAIVAALGY